METAHSYSYFQTGERNNIKRGSTGRETHESQLGKHVVTKQTDANEAKTGENRFTQNRSLHSITNTRALKISYKTIKP